MRTVGVRELKARLSSVLRDVQRGEVVLVTDRGRVVAELRSPGAGLSGRAADPLAALAASGRLRVAESRANLYPPYPPYPPSPLSSPAGAARELLDQDRGER